MKLFFRTLRGEPFEITINEKTTVENIKERLEKEFYLISSNIRLINGTEILTDKTVIDPQNFVFNGFIVIHESNQSLRKDIVKPTITKGYSNIIRTNSSTNSQDAKKDLKKVILVDTKRGKTKFKSGGFNQVDKKFESTQEFQEILQSFIMMGFKKTDSLDGLRKCNYDIDATLNYLYSGVLPSEEVEEEVEEIEIKPEPKPAPKPREYDVSGLSRYRFDAILDPQVQQLTNKQKYDLLRFLDEHRDLELSYLVQIFFSCDCDYTIATHCLVDV